MPYGKRRSRARRIVESTSRKVSGWRRMEAIVVLTAPQKTRGRGGGFARGTTRVRHQDQAPPPGGDEVALPSAGGPGPYPPPKICPPRGAGMRPATPPQPPS